MASWVSAAVGKRRYMKHLSLTLAVQLHKVFARKRLLEAHEVTWSELVSDVRVRVNDVYDEK